MQNFQGQKRLHEQTLIKNRVAQAQYADWQARAAAQPASSYWRTKRDELAKQAEAYNAAYPIMTQLERQERGQDLHDKREANRQVIETGVIGEHTAAIEAYKAAKSKVFQAQADLTNSWDRGRLSQELAIYTALISAAAQAGNLAELEAITQEARDSDDPYKVRACAVIVQSSAAKLPPGTQDSHGNDGRLIVNRLQLAAGRDLEALKTSPQLEAANQALDAARDAMQAANAEIRITCEAYGEVLPNGQLHNYELEKALARVRKHPDGFFETYEEQENQS
jgi:hypothetical protein